MRSAWGTEYRWACQDCRATGESTDQDDPMGAAVRGARRHAVAEGHPVEVLKLAIVVWPDPPAEVEEVDDAG